MRQFMVAVMVVALWSPVVLANDVDSGGDAAVNTCSGLADAAASIMLARQQGMTHEQVSEILRSEINDEVYLNYMMGMLNDAFAVPVADTPDTRMEAVRDFKGETMHQCLKAMRPS